MNILCLLNDGPDVSSIEWMKALSQDHAIEVVDLKEKQIPYDALVDKIFACDKVISW